MSLRNKITLAIVAWALMETVAFAAVAEAVGIGGAILIGIGTSLIGAALAKQLGRSVMGELRRGLGPGLGTSGGFVQSNLSADGVLAGLAALLLLLPGFITDTIGLALAVPVLRRMLTRWVAFSGFRTTGAGAPGNGGRAAPRHGPATIDLDPQDWRPADVSSGIVPKV